MAAHTSYTEDLELRLLKIGRSYDALKSAAHAAVTYWLLTSAERFTLRLHFFERERQRVGDILAQEPPNGTYYRYGLMADDRIAVEECYQKGTLAYEAFWQHTPNTTESVRFTKGKSVFIAKLEYADGLPILYRHYGAELRVMQKQTATVRARETYTHWDARRTTIKVEDGRMAVDYECIYTPQHEIERIDVPTFFPAGYMNTIYRSPSTRESTTPRIANRQAIVNSIVEAVANEHVTEPVCGLMLNYTQGEWFPPGVVLLYNADREAYLADDPTLELIWNAEAISPGQSHYITLLNALDLWADLEEELGLNDDTIESYKNPAPRAALADIARDLIAVDWTGKLPITDDFVAFSMDYEGDSVQERLAASVPQAKLDLLRARGLW